MAHSPLATPSETIAVLKRHGLATKKALGQHFLIDDNVIGRIIALAKLAGDETVIEIGPGIGTLTAALCQHAGAVVAVERDSDLLPALAETTADCARLAIVRADAVAVSPEALAEPFGPPVAMVANLPYAVAATVVLRFFEEIPSLQSATIMVQAEVADRMAASPGTKDFGAYTVKLRLLAKPAGRFAVSRSCFLPPPRVDSAVLRLERAPLATDPALLHAAARAAEAGFAQRRKTIRNSLKSTLGLDAEALDAALEAAGVDGSLRAEALDPEKFLALAKALPNVEA
ncbi:MAG: 16S rRNA (adenine(1518)-N(6)/adenine(1519)-N(6))-dimethyltransferase RsmA [Coriobacteriia bacterium]|nr:16S rRNA (adenine(1518)-N(6)/adenine(1519)-N(6))-dimethyltransferase RsmA [Coriobacteriia bacterium]